MIFITFIPNVLSFSLYIKQARQFPLEALIKVGIEAGKEVLGNLSRLRLKSVMTLSCRLCLMSVIATNHVAPCPSNRFPRCRFHKAFIMQKCSWHGNQLRLWMLAVRHI